MHIGTSLLLLLATQSHLVDAGFAPHLALLRATEHLHSFAKRRSVRLARDLRVAFQGLRVQEVALNDPGRVVCLRPDDPFAGLGGGSNTSPANGTSRPRPTTRPTATGSSGQPVPTSAFQLIDSHSGNDFFDGWSFWDHNTNGGDPTQGNVDYVNQNDAMAAGLLEVNSAGHAIMRLESTPQVAGNRKAIRITTQNTYTTGLFILDAVHMPHGCGTWPAFWTNGPNWPIGGEIDILEGVHEYTNNQATLHTNTGCTLPSGSTPQSLDVQSTMVSGLNCGAVASGNSGCGFRSNFNNTYGLGFNSVGGGVYAMLWDDDNGIMVWFFPRASIPNDIDAESPQPQSWGSPMAFWPASTCNPEQFFFSHSAIFTNTLCGEWAGSVWNAAGVPGQEQSCQQLTGVATCAQFVQQSGSSFIDAFWEVVSVKIYQKSRRS